MKFMSVLFAILAIIGLGQTRQLPNFGSGSVYDEQTLEDELIDFLKFIPVEKWTEVVTKYINEDVKIQSALLYLFDVEFHDLLRSIEALKEYDALVKYLQNTGLDVISYIKTFHKTIGMEDYVPPPKVENIFESQIGIQKVGDGMAGMIKDLYDLLPIDKIDALYKQKLEDSQMFADFIAAVKSPKLQEIVTNLYGNQTFKDFVMKCREKGLEFQELTKLVARIFGIQFPY
ncbi:hypothetical protein P5V15_006739 [Pogonomyrmex californicus]